MKNNYFIGLVLIALVFTGAGCFAQEEVTTEENQSPSTYAVVNISPEDDASEEEEEEEEVEVEEVIEYGEYKTYSEAELAEAYEKGKRVVLFFHATWCPLCKQADTEFLRDVTKLPDDVVLLKTDYDSETALKQKYSVTYQHTFVQIDEDGEQVTKWISGGMDKLLANVR